MGLLACLLLLCLYLPSPSPLFVVPSPSSLSLVNCVEDGCCPFKIVFDEDLYAVVDEDFYVLSMYLCFALRMS